MKSRTEELYAEKKKTKQKKRKKKQTNKLRKSNLGVERAKKMAE